MLLSVLIPSRGRPKRLEKAIQSLLQTADKPDDIEVLVRIDEDDPEREHYHDDHTPQRKILEGPRYRGYRDLYIHWNELAALAEGKWMFAFNDDAMMQTPGWDAEVRELPFEVCLTGPKDDSTLDGSWIAFPIFPRIIYERLGYVTRFCGIDTWLHHVIRFSKKWPCFHLDSRVVHLRPTNPRYASLMDDTYKESLAAEKEVGLDFDVVRKDFWQKQVREDIDKLDG